MARTKEVLERGIEMKKKRKLWIILLAYLVILVFIFAFPFWSAKVTERTIIAIVLGIIIAAELLEKISK